MRLPDSAAHRHRSPGTRRRGAAPQQVGALRALPSPGGAAPPGSPPAGNPRLPPPPPLPGSLRPAAELGGEEGEEAGPGAASGGGDREAAPGARGDLPVWGGLGTGRGS